MWRELLLFAVIIPAGLLTAGFVIYKRYMLSARGKMNLITARRKEATKLKRQYDILALDETLDLLSEDDLKEMKKLKEQIVEYEKLLEKETAKV